MLEKKMGPATRDSYGKELAELGKENEKIIVLDADLATSTRTSFFAKAFPKRFWNVGISEANMVGIAAGLASEGYIPFISSFACFLMCKGYDQLRVSVVYPELNVKIVASHGGIITGEDGPSQQSIEDFALALSFPKLVTLSPCDDVSARALVRATAKYVGPVYMRTIRAKLPLVYGEGSATGLTPTFEIGKAIELRKGKDVAILATGTMVFESLAAAEDLEKAGISASVYDFHSLKPIDREMIEKAAKNHAAIVVAEEHQIFGGLGSIVARVVGETTPRPMEFVAIQDTYAESGAPEELMEKYGLTGKHIAEAVKRALQKRL